VFNRNNRPDTVSDKRRKGPPMTTKLRAGDVVDKRLEKLKREARGYYLAYRNSGSYLDCGTSMAEMLNPSIYEYRTKYNELVKQINAIDPNSPLVEIGRL
jgi:hypothetical protein